MDMVSAVKHSLDLNLKKLGKKDSAIRATGDGDGQMRLGYIGEGGEEHLEVTRHNPLPSEGYVIQFKTNPAKRQYSGDVQRLSRRLGSLNALSDNLKSVEHASDNLQAHIAVTQGDSEAYFENPGELMALATEMESFRKSTSAEVQKLRDDGVDIQDGTRGLTIDFGDPSSARTSVQEFQGVTRSIREFVGSELHSADSQLGYIVEQKTPHPFEPDESAPQIGRDPLAAFVREVHSEMLDAGQQMISAQANLDPVKVYELLSE
jgi:hypothetical protein